MFRRFISRSPFAFISFLATALLTLAAAPARNQFEQKQASVDPAEGSWSDTGSLGTKHSSHTATLLPSGKLLVAGGTYGSGQFYSAELYDPAAGTWMTTGSLSTKRYEHTATLLPNGKVLVAGGSSNGFFLSSVELYDPAAGSGRRRAAWLLFALFTLRPCCPPGTYWLLAAEIVLVVVT